MESVLGSSSAERSHGRELHESVSHRDGLLQGAEQLEIHFCYSIDAEHIAQFLFMLFAFFLIISLFGALISEAMISWRSRRILALEGGGRAVAMEKFFDEKTCMSSHVIL
jgi:hypothetical protein